MYDRYKNFTVMILKLHRCIQKIKSEEISEFNLKSSHVSCLYYLYKEDAMTLTELSELCQEDKSYLARSLRGLEEDGYIVCESTAKKRYNALLHLTEKGREVGEFVAKKIDTVLEPASDGVSEEDRNVLYRSLAQITENLEKICKKYTREQSV